MTTEEKFKLFRESTVKVVEALRVVNDAIEEADSIYIDVTPEEIEQFTEMAKADADFVTLCDELDELREKIYH